VFADIFTYIEHRGPITGKTVAWVGDANNMLYSWLQAAEVFGFHVNVSTPHGYEMDMSLVSTDRFTLFANPSDACDGAHLVNTDVWTSMGYEAENAARLKAFDGWIVDSAKMARAARTRCSCTACRPTAARKCRPKSSTARNRWSGTRRKTACTCRKR
jgi:ornithine carbamoyltransferase